MRPPYLLITDVDDTVLGDDPALERFTKFFDAVRDRLGIVYASGRFARSVEVSIRAHRMPEPLAVIGGVGTELLRYPTFDAINDWPARIARAWDADVVRQIFARERDLEPQPPECQSDYKVSYFLRDASDARLEDLRERLRAAGLETALIYSSARDLDVLPAGVDKGAAAAFLASEWSYAPEHVCVSGNSGNDAALFEHGFRGIVVANAHEELKAVARDHRAFIAPAPFADGVREGLRHWLEI
ncbi:MAG TPA: HAD family hydrolase [Planctomycetota bacterium]|nr:HAD family hydrolase [Planctomycetota bacterium]